MNIRKNQEERPLPTGRVELVAIDLDGTLIRSDQSLSRRTINAVHAATAKGVHVVLASARPPRGAKAFYQALKLQTLQINHNGALVIDPVQNKVIFHMPLPGGVAKAVIQIARHVDPKTVVGVDIIDKICVDKVYKAGDPPPKPGPSDIELALNQPVSKVMLAGPPTSLSDIQGVMGRKLAGHVGYTYSNMNLLQVVHPDVDKAKAVALVAQHYKVARDRVMVIGDAPNDIGMIQWAGLGVAMGNGWANVRKAAHVVVASNDDDGVAEALEKYVL